MPEWAVEVERLRKVFRVSEPGGRGHEDVAAVDDVSFTVAPGRSLAIVGESGSGKTTLGLAILRLISSQGPIVFMGNALQGLTFKRMRPYRRDMQMVFQDPFGSLSPRMSVADIITEGIGIHMPELTVAQREQRRHQQQRHFHQHEHAEESWWP